MEVMIMKRTTMEMIEKSVNEGYEMLAQGTGKYDAFYQSIFDEFRAKGFDVRSWLLKDEEGYAWVIYGKKRSTRGRKAKVVAPKIDFASLTVKDLRKYCQEKKVTGYSKMKKEEMIRVLSEAC